MIFGINTTRAISKLSQISLAWRAREITYNNFEISLAVFMTNITTNHAITYTNWVLLTLSAQFSHRMAWLQQQRALFAWPYKFIQYCKSDFKNQSYITGQLRYFGNNLSRTSKQAEIYFMNCILIK